MSKLHLVSVRITNAGGTSSSADVYGVVSDNWEPIEEDERANIEDGQEVIIDMTGGLSWETRNTNTGATNAGTAIMSDARVNSISQKARLVGTFSNGTTLTVDNVYLSGRKCRISTGELGVKLSARRTDDPANDPNVWS